VQRGQANLKGSILADTMDSPLQVGKANGQGGFPLTSLGYGTSPAASPASL